MLFTRRFGLWFAVLALGGHYVLAMAPDKTPTPFPRLLGGFGRPRETPLPGLPTGSYEPQFIGGASPSDEGPVSFDTKGYDWNAYAAEMVQRIRLHWGVPELARAGWKGISTIRFYILADGRVRDARVIRYSGIPPFDSAALQAILKSSPFRPLPGELHEEREGITMAFLYNMRPESGPDRSSPPIPTPVLIRASRTAPPAAPTTPTTRPLPRLGGLARASEETDFGQPAFDSPAYIARLVKIVSMNWYKPEQRVSTAPVVQFQIERDGTVSSPRILISSGDAFADRAALRAVFASSPLPPLPDEYVGSWLRIQVVFE